MFGTIRRHQTWLWAIISTLTIVSFLYFFSPATRANRNMARGDDLGRINGDTITREEFNNAYKDSLLQYYMSTRSWLSEADKKNNYDPERTAYQRLFVIRKAEELGIHVGSDTAGQYATVFLQQAIRTTPKDFAERVLQPHGFTMEDLDRYFRNELAIKELINSVALCGVLVTTQEVKAVYIREYETLSSQAVFFSASNYLAQVTASPEAISLFYSNRQAFYRLPDRVQVSYVKFPASNYLAQVEKEHTNLNEQVELEFQRFGSNYLNEAKTPEAAKAKIKQEMLDYLALRGEASKAAKEFGAKLAEITNAGPDTLEMVAKSNNLPVQVSPPFDKQDPPRDLDVNPDIGKIAFRLTPDDPISAPILGKDCIVIMALKNSLPSQNPSFESVRDKVTFDYKYAEAMKLARKAGADFDKLAASGMAQGKTFDAVCAEGNVKPVSLPPFAISTTELPEIEDHMDIRQLKQIAFSTPVGKLSGFQPSLDGGVELYIKSKSPPDENKMQTELPIFVARVRQARESRAFEAWFGKEAQRGLADIPYFQRKDKEQQQMSGRAPKSS